ncbi:MAG: aminotransferase class V-fold PLP-dependent enzyme [Myxococcales bacterium]|nr:aminotransferase class V-fold PLP-dependent enzyme [Myxococcota bacterium]MDW8282017.1 aminotransferase class V-fold PLP-dependent enzyme [Myxococcales bacterium]
MPSLPAPAEQAKHFCLEAGVVFLNHGSFGACPRPVLAEQDRLRVRLEQEPVRFFLQEAPVLLGRARAALAELVGADEQDLVFVANATTAVNAVLRSLDLRPGDELLETDHSYNACRNVLRYLAARTGALVRTVALPLPISGPQEVVERVLQEVTPRTRLALLDHVTSPTALVLPVAELVRALQERGVDTLVDGAHAPGMLPLDLRALGAAYYAGNCHKWLCTPKGAGFLYVRRDRQVGLVPPVISHGYNAPPSEQPRLHALFDWTGTVDPTPALCVPAAIAFLSGLMPGGLAALQERNRQLACQARQVLCAALGLPPPCPQQMLGSMAAVPLPDEDRGTPRSPLQPDPLQTELRERFGIQVPIMSWPAWPHRLLRISAQAYNSLAQYEYLAEALGTLLGASRR